MIYDPKTYNFATRRLSKIALTQLWLPICFAVFYVILMLIGVSAESDFILTFMGILSFAYAIAMLVIFIMYFIRWYDFKRVLEGGDQKNAKLVITSIWIQIIAGLVSVIGSIGTITALIGAINDLNDSAAISDALGVGMGATGIIGILGFIASIVAYVLLLVGYAGLNKSQTLYEWTANGFGKIFNANILVIISAVVFFILSYLFILIEVPVAVAILALAFLIVAIIALVFMFQGWHRVGIPAPDPEA